MAWRRLHVFGNNGPERNVPAVIPKPIHCATHRVLALRHALQHDPGAALVLKEERALLQLIDELYTAECRLVRRRVAASRHTQLVVVLVQCGHDLRPALRSFLAGASGCLGVHRSELTELEVVST